MKLVRLGVCTLLIACGPSARQDPSADASGSGDGPGQDRDGSGGNADANLDQIAVYAHSYETLYRVDPVTLAITEVGPFIWDEGDVDESMTDIAIDASGRMLGISFDSVYQVDSATARCMRLSSGLTNRFNGLSFVPADINDPSGPEILVAIRADDGVVFEINPATGGTIAIGDMGFPNTSSGDVVSVRDFGTFVTIDGSIVDTDTLPDVLGRLTGSNYAATRIGVNIGYDRIWGLAYWTGRLFGFTEAGQFILIDPIDGSAELIAQVGHAWWGAAVTTIAPVIE
jgi:hypothetical protein